MISESKVMLLHNEHIIEEQPACGETLCTVADFKAYYQHIVDFDWDTQCLMPENASDYYDDNEVTTEAVNFTDFNAGGGESTTKADKNNSVISDETEDYYSDEKDCDNEDSDEDDSDENDSAENDSSEKKDKKHKKEKKNKKCKKDQSSEEDSDEK